MTVLRRWLASVRAGWRRLYTSLGFTTVANTFRRGVAIASASAAVLGHHPRLLAFPVASTVAVLAIMMRFVPFQMFVSSVPDGVLPIARDGTWAMVAALLGTYLVCVFIATVANAGLMVGALATMNAKPVSLLSALGIAIWRFPQLVIWSIATATVGFVARTVGAASKQSLDRTGAGAAELPLLIAAIIGGGLFIFWAATYFVLPVVVFEGLGPIAAVKRSTALIEARWHATCTAAARFGLLNFILLAVAIIAFMVATEKFPISREATAALFATLVAFIVVLQIVLSALGAVFVAAVYRYAVTGLAPTTFDGGLVETALCGQPQQNGTA